MSLFGLACAGHLVSHCWLTKSAPQVVLVSHSWGDSVVRAFMRWAAAGDSDWVERHVAAYVNIAGPTLGVPKAVTALLSGAQAPRVQGGLLETRWAGSVRWCTHRATLVTENIYPVDETAGLNDISSTAYRGCGSIDKVEQLPFKRLLSQAGCSNHCSKTKP